MINKIIDGISKAINEEFGNGYEIYTEEVEQGLQEPCFSIVCVEPSNNLFRQNRYFRQNKFCIHYFPSTNNARNECQAVMERLYDCLEWIEIVDVVDKVKYPSKTMGTNMNAEYSDGVLNFFVNFDMYVKKVEEKTPMDSYDYGADVKER
jgi:hypothetical protein